MKKYFFLIIIHIVSYADAQDWTKVYSFPGASVMSQGPFIQNFQMIDNNKGYISTVWSSGGSSTNPAFLYYTDKRCQTWEMERSINTDMLGTSASISFSFLSKDVGFMYDSRNGCLSQGVLFDSGQTNQINKLYLDNCPYYIKYLNADSIIILGDAELLGIYCISDNILLDFNFCDNCYFEIEEACKQCIEITDFFFSNHFSYLVGNKNDSLFIYKSLEGTTNFSVDTLDFFTEISQINFATKDYGVIAGTDSKLYKSEDGGETWDTIIISGIEKIIEVELSTLKLIVASDAGIFESSDKGVTWEQRNIGFNRWLRNIELTDDTTAYIIEGYNNVYSNYAYPVSINEKVNNLHHVSIYPNPARNVIYFKNTTSDAVYLKVANISGNPLMSRTIQGNSTFEMNISNLSRGVYIAYTNFQDKYQVRKIIIEN